MGLGDFFKRFRKPKEEEPSLEFEEGAFGEEEMPSVGEEPSLLEQGIGEEAEPFKEAEAGSEVAPFGEAEAIEEEAREPGGFEALEEEITPARPITGKQVMLILGVGVVCILLGLVLRPLMDKYLLGKGAEEVAVPSGMSPEDQLKKTQSQLTSLERELEMFRGLGKPEDMATAKKELENLKTQLPNPDEELASWKEKENAYDKIVEEQLSIEAKIRDNRKAIEGMKQEQRKALKSLKASQDKWQQVYTSYLATTEEARQLEQRVAFMEIADSRALDKQTKKLEKKLTTIAQESLSPPPPPPSPSPPLEMQGPQ